MRAGRKFQDKIENNFMQLCNYHWCFSYKLQIRLLSLFNRFFVVVDVRVGVINIVDIILSLLMLSVLAIEECFISLEDIIVLFIILLKGLGRLSVSKPLRLKPTSGCWLF